MGMEYLPRYSHADSDDDDDNSDSDAGTVEKRMEEYKQYAKKHRVCCDRLFVAVWVVQVL